MTKINVLKLAVVLLVALITCVLGLKISPILIAVGAIFLAMYLIVFPIRQIQQARMKQLLVGNRGRLVTQVFIPKWSEWRDLADMLDLPSRRVITYDRIFGLVVGDGTMQLYRGGARLKLAIDVPTNHVSSLRMRIEPMYLNGVMPTLTILWKSGDRSVETSMDEWLGRTSVDHTVSGSMKFTIELREHLAFGRSVSSIPIVKLDD